MTPIRIGVWCDYGVTLTPTEGIGVFVANLVEGLLNLEEQIEVTLLVRPGDQPIAGSLQKKYPHRLQIVPPIWPRIHGSPAGTNVLQAGVRLIARVLRMTQGLKRRFDLLEKRSSLAFSSILAVTRKGTSVLITAFWRVLKGLPFLGPTCRRFDGLFNPTIVCRNAACDVWLIPNDRLIHPLPNPSVLVIHDLVQVHYPDAVPEDVRAELLKVVPLRAAEATLCACMSRFIWDMDLRGVLKLPAEKLRLIRPAPPSDFPSITSAQALRLKPPNLTRPYFFYPAAFRSYKNHGALIDALHILRQRLGEDSYDLVFTGIHTMPKELKRKIADHGLPERVHVLGCVDRRALSALYRCAFATIVPSLYEQGSFPIYEALHWGCPVASSNIPALVEQCQPLGDAMIYFDPHDPMAIARAMLRFREDRQAILARQQAVKPVLWQRTWQDAARDWLQVFRDAIELAGAHRTSLAA